MAGDDEVIIKVSADLAAAYSALEGLKEQFRSVIDGMKKLADQARANGESTEVLDAAILKLAESFNQTFTQASERVVESVKGMTATIVEVIGPIEAANVVQEVFGESAEIVAKKLGLETEAVQKNADITEDSTEKLAGLAERLHELNERRLEDAVSIALMTAKEKEETVEMASALLRQGESLQVVAERAGLSTEAMKLLFAEQAGFKKAVEDSVDPLERLAQSLDAVYKQQQEDQAALATMTESYKDSLATMSQELLNAGMSFAEVATKAGLTKDQLTLLFAEQVALKQSIEDSIDPLTRLRETYDQLNQQQEATQASIAGMSAEYKVSVADMSRELLKQGMSFKEVAASAGLTEDSLRALLDEQAALKKSVEDSIDPLVRLGESLTQLHDTQAKDQAVLAGLTQEYKASLYEMSQELLKGGAAFDVVTEKSGLTREQFVLLTAEQKKLADEAKPFWENWLTGIKGSEVATVAFGVLAADAFKQVGSMVLEAAASFPAFIEGMANAGDGLKTMAARLGTTTTAIAEMKYIGEQAGVSTEIMARSMQGFSASLTDSGSKASQAIRGLGLSIEELKKMSDTDALRVVVDRIRELPPNIDKGAKMMEVFGAKARGMTQLVSEDLGKLQEDFKALGGAENQEALGNLGDEFNDLSNNIKVAGESFERSIAVTFLPVINTVLEKVPLLGGAVISLGGTFVDLGQSMMPIIGTWALMTTSDKGLKGLTDAFAGAGGKIQTFGSDLLKLGGAIKANFIPNMLAMTKAIYASTAALLTNPFVLAAAAIVALGVVVYKLIGGWEGITKAMAPVLEFFNDVTLIATRLAESVFADLVGWVNELITAFASLFSSTGAGVSTLNKLLTWAEEWITWLEQFPIIGQYIRLVKAEIDLLWGAAKSLYDWVVKFGGTIVGWFKAVKDEAHETAEGIRQQDDMVKQATKTLEDQKKAKEALAAGSKKEQTNLEKMAARVDYLNSAYTSLSAAEKAAIVAGEKAGLSSKEIAEDLRKTLYHGVTSVEDATKIVDRYKDKLKEAEAEAKKNPFKKLMEDATALSKALDLAAKAGIPLTEQIDEYGKKASEIAQKAAMRGELEKIPPKIVEMGRAWEQAQLAVLMEKTNTAAVDLSRTFNEKLTTASAEASAAIVAMQGAITESALRGTALRLAVIEREKQASLTANAEKVRQLDVTLAAQRDKEWELAQKRIDDIKKVEGSISAERQAAIMVEHSARIAAYTADNEALKAKYEDEAAIIKMNSERQRMIAEGDLAYFEEVMKERGQITKTVLAEQLAEETKTLAIMRIKHTEFSQFQIEEQQRKVDALADLGEKEAKDRGLITKKAGEIELAIQQSNLAYMQANKEKFYQWEIDAAKAVAEKLTSVFQQEAKKRGIETKADVEERKRKAQELVDWMIKNEEKFTSAQIAEAKKRLRQAEQEAGTMLGIWTKVFNRIGQAGSAIGSVFDELGAQGSEAMAKVGSAIGSAMEILGGVESLTAMLDAKDTIGAIIAACKIAVAAIKAMWDAFTKSPGEDVVGRVGQRMGVVIGEEMGDAIAKTAKDKFKGDRFAAEVFHLADIVEAAGGVTEKNFDKLLGGLRDTFAMIENKSFTIEQARDVLDKNFGAFADHVVKSGKIASAAFVEMIQLNQKFGTQSKEIADFVSGQVERLGTAFEKMVSPLAKAAEPFEDLKKETEELAKLSADRTKAIEAATAKAVKGGKDEKKALEEIQKTQGATIDAQKKKVDELLAKQKQVATESMPAIERAGRLMMSSFNASIKSGVSMLDAVEKLGPGLDSILKTMGNLGIDVDKSSVAYIVQFRNRVNANKELVESTANLNEVMTAMSNIGALNEDSFKDLQAQGLDSYAKLEAAGFSGNESLTMMKGFLENARDAHAEMGLPIDENTAKLIAEAEAQGILTEKQLDGNKIMMEGLGAIITAVGGTLPAAWDTAGKAAAETAKKIKEDLDKTVGDELDEQAKQLAEKNKWDEYARDAERAALATKKSLAKVDGSIEDVQDGLEDTDWSGWAKEAVDAAKRVEGSVTGVAEGHSPGGIKEIPIRLAQANRAFKIWERVGVQSAENLQATIDSMHSRDLEMMRGRDLGMTGIRTAGIPTQVPSGDFVREVTKDDAVEGNQAVNLTFNITSMDPAGVELVTERKILPAMVKILRRGRNLADMQTVLNLKG